MYCRLQVPFELIHCLNGGILAILYRGKKGCGVDEAVFFGAFPSWAHLPFAARREGTFSRHRKDSK